MAQRCVLRQEGEISTANSPDPLKEDRKGRTGCLVDWDCLTPLFWSPCNHKHKREEEMVSR